MHLLVESTGIADDQSVRCSSPQGGETGLTVAAGGPRTWGGALKSEKKIDKYVLTQGTSLWLMIRGL